MFKNSTRRRWPIANRQSASLSCTSKSDHLRINIFYHTFYQRRSSFKFVRTVSNYFYGYIHGWIFRHRNHPNSGWPTGRIHHHQSRARNRSLRSGCTHYLLKPLEQSAVWEDGSLPFPLRETAQPVLHIQNNQGNIFILPHKSTILVYNKLCIVHTDQQQLSTPLLNTLFEQLINHQFLRTAAQLCSKHGIYRFFSSNKLVLKDGTEISLSRNNRKRN